MTTMQQVRPSWYTHDDDSAWERVKEAFRRDWQQTKHDFGGDEPDLKQDVDDTVGQITGSRKIPPDNVPNRDDDRSMPEVYSEQDEPAYRYGYAAYRHHGGCCDWNAETEAMLSKDWGGGTEWSEARPAIRRGWYYAKFKNDNCDSCN